MRAAMLAGLVSIGFSAPALGQFAKPVAVVNGEAIPRSELDAVLKLRPQAITPLTAGQARAMNEQVVAILIEEALLRQFLAKNAPPIDSAEVDKQFASLQAGLKTQGKSLADYCKETQQTEKQVRGNIEMMLRWTAYSNKSLPETELQKYYTENREFFDKVTVRCSHIVYRVGPDATPAERANAGQKLAELRGQIAAGKITFAEAALKFSHCPSASKGGDLGYITRKWMVEEPFAKAAFALKPGELSPVVTTDFGVHLVVAVDRKAGEPSEFAKVKDDVRDSAAEELRQKVLSDLKKSSKIEVNMP